MADIQRFNPENCDPLTRIIFADWATVPMIRAYKFLRDSSDVMYKFKSIAEFLGVSIGTAHSAIKTLQDKGYIVENNGVYSINVAKIQKTENFQKNEKVFQNSEKVIQKTENNFQKTERTNNTLNNNIINNNIKEYTPPPAEVSESKFEEIAEQAFEPDESKYQSDNRFINAGLRPLKKYPNIWLTKFELIDTLQNYENVGIPIDSREFHHLAFKNVEAKLLRYIQDGKTVKNVSCYSWLNGFALNETLEILIKRNRLKKSEAA